MEKQELKASNANPHPNPNLNPNANPSAEKAKPKKHHKPKRAPVRMRLLSIRYCFYMYSCTYEYNQYLFEEQCTCLAERATVLILGGGMAGVAAAHTLQAAGMHDFLLLEAADRLGGRMRDTSFCGMRSHVSCTHELYRTCAREALVQSRVLTHRGKANFFYYGS